MEGIILAAGQGKRMRPLTLETPKPLLHLHDRPLLEWSLYSLRGIVRRVLVVVHYLKEQIADFMAGQRVFADYALVEQLPAPLGTGHALRCCRPHLRSEDFLVINGDDLFPRAALLALSRAEYGILSMQRADYPRYGVIQLDDQGDFIGIDEKPPAGRYPSSAPCNIGAYKLQPSIFDCAPAPSVRGEVELTDMVTAIARTQRVELVESSWWLPIGDPQALAAAQSVDVKRNMVAL
ncbi:MAG: nucleotidyltransferase family protein [Chloroflexi bacterium]|nr:nucleotidyltransferase family protein [Chloroflexota bacterium]